VKTLITRNIIIVTGWLMLNVLVCDRASAKTTSEIQQIAKAVTVKIEHNVSNDSKKGSGILYKQQGGVYTVITNAHVICSGPGKGSRNCAKPSSYTITTPDNKKYQVLSTDASPVNSDIDLGIIKFRSSTTYSIAQFADSSKIKNQDSVHSAGFPSDSSRLAFGTGRVIANAKSRSKEDNGYTVLYDAFTTGGMSGSGIFNSQGQILAIHGQGDRFISKANLSDEYQYRINEKVGINRGIPSNRVIAIINQPNSSQVGEFASPSTADELLVAAYNQVISKKSGKNIEFERQEAMQLAVRAIKREPRYIYAYLFRGWLLTIQKKYKPAIQDLDQAISLDSKYSYSYLLRASAKALTKDYRGALKDYNTTLSLNPEIYSALEDRGFVKIALKDYKGALEDFNRSLQITSQYGSKSLLAYLGKCRISSEIGRQKNTQDCDEAIKIYENNGVSGRVIFSAYANRGAFRFKTGDRAGALSDLDTAISLNNTDSAPYINRGSLRYAMGNKKEALLDFRQALKLGSEDINMYLGIAIIEEEEGEIEESLSAYEKALAFYTRQGNLVASATVQYRIDNLRKRSASGIRVNKPTVARRSQVDREIRTNFNLAYSVDGVDLLPVSPRDQNFDTFARNSHENEQRLSGSSSLVVFSSSGQLLAAGDSEGNLSIWQFQGNGQFTKVFAQNTNLTIRGIAITPDDKTLLITNGIEIIFWRLSDGTIVRRLDSIRMLNYSIKISPDGQTLATISAGNTIKIWRLSDGVLLKTLTGHQLGIESIVFSPDGRTIISGSRDKTIKIWRLQDGQILRSISLTGQLNVPKLLTISSNGKVIISMNSSVTNLLLDNDVTAWEFDTGNRINTIKDRGISSVVISPGGQTFITSNVSHSTGDVSYDLKIWRLQTGELLRTIKGHQSEISSVAISPDGRTLASSGRDRSVKIWQASPQLKPRNR
jgi:tetratricopeptide (TPR) repeat protein